MPLTAQCHPHNAADAMQYYKGYEFQIAQHFMLAHRDKDAQVQAKSQVITIGTVCFLHDNLADILALVPKATHRLALHMHSMIRLDARYRYFTG